MIENIITINFNKVNYWDRVCISIRKLLSNPTVLILMFVFFILMLLSILKQSNILFIILVLNLGLFFAPIFFVECKNYIHTIKFSKDKLEIYYQSYSKSCVVIEQFDKIRVIEFDQTPGSITAKNFKVYRDFGKGHHKFLINQYEILEWSKTENIERLKSLLNKS